MGLHKKTYKMARRRNVGRSRRTFTETLKRQVIEYYLSNYVTKTEVWEKFVGKDEERGRILRWMRQLGYATEKIHRRPYLNVMKKDQNKTSSKDMISDPQLVEELRKQLEEEKLKAISYSKMIDIAEKEFKISIRKKSNTKL